ncbi:rhodanese-like domain-containing protein [Herpetosiphon sp. NSE202]|uniref:rhodanese-like domain-containing protein n=1 Tax=Herpetosiphon sp. NSE202 TaxID=3351349 RepID=UPI003643461B
MELAFILTVEAVKQQLQAGNDLVLLDVRTAAEFENLHIAGSLHVPLDQLEQQAQELSATLKAPVVLVCRSGQRSQQAANILQHIDLPSLHILAGGIQAWLAAGETVTRGRQRWALERQVCGVAGGIVLGSMLGSLVWPRLRWVAAGIGAGLTFSALTDTCAMGTLLSKLPYNRLPTTAPQAVAETGLLEHNGLVNG